jgi:hypothetical protein
MTYTSTDLEAMEYLISRLYQAEEKLGPFPDDTYTAGSQFLESFQSPQRPEVEHEFNQLIADLREARDYNHHLLTFLRILQSDWQEIERDPVYGG